MKDRKDLPPVTANNFLERVKEELTVYMGNRGEPLDQAVRFRDLSDANIVNLRPGFRGGGSGIAIQGPGTAITKPGDVDLTPPPTPTGFLVSAAISHVFAETDAPLFLMGHGYGRTVLYGAKRASLAVPAPTFSTAVELAQFIGTVYAYPSNPATTWHLWVKWKTVDGVLSIDPAGGVNGLVTTTGQDVTALIKALTGAITSTELDNTLRGRVNLIDGTGVGSVAANIAIEAAARANALANEATTRATDLANEAITRTAAVANEAVARGAAIADEASARGAAIANEANVRATAITLEVTTRVAAIAVNTTAIANETTARSSAIADEATARTASVITETNARTQAVAIEAQARIDAVSAEASVRAQQILTEQNTRAQAVLDEAATRGAGLLAVTKNISDGLLAEATARGTDITSVNTLRKQGDDQLASTLVTLTATVNTNLQSSTAAVQTEAGARATADTAEATQRTQLAARVTATEGVGTTNTASITAEQTARASGDQANAASILTLASTVQGNAGTAAAALQTESATRATADTAEATQRAQLAVRVTTAEGGISTNTGAITNEASVRATGDVVNANAISSLTAVVNNNASTGTAAVQTEATARANADTAEASQRTILAARVTLNEGGVATNTASIQTEATTRANADSANATSIQSLAASVITRPNLCADVDKWSLSPTFFVANNYWGQVVYGFGLANGTYVCQSPVFSCAAGATFTVTGDTALFVDSGSCYFDIQFLDGAGALLLDGPQNALSNRHDFSTDNTNRVAHAISCTAPTGCSGGFVRFIVEGGVNIRAVGFRQVKVEFGFLPATPYTQESQLGITAAAIKTESTARADADAAEAAQRTTLAAQMHGGYTGSDINAINTGLLYQERIARATQDGALAQQITLLSAGAGEQFDYKKIFYFDVDAEGWTSVGVATTATAGFLNCALNAAGSNITSPIGLGVDATKYSQVRLRIRKTGTNTWGGKIWWTRTGDTGFIPARSQSFPEPTYDANGIGLITLNPPWDGVIDQINFDFTGGQTSANKFTVDFVAIGRPSPGASSAELLDERTARASADLAEVTSRQALSSKLTGVPDPTGVSLGSLSTGLIFDERQARSAQDSALATSISTLTATVTGNAGVAQAAVNSEASARATADTTNATAIQSLTASNSTRPNLCADVSSWTLQAPCYVSFDSWGKTIRAINPTVGTYVCYSPTMPCYASQTYTVTGDSLLYSAGGAVWFNLIFRDASGTVLLDGPRGSVSAYHDHSNSNSTRNLHAVSCVAPAGAVEMLARFVALSFDPGALSFSAFGFRQVKVEQGGLPATGFTQEGYSQSLDAAIVTERTARTTADTAFAQQTDAIVARSNTDRNNNSAALLTEQTERANADSASSTRIDTLTSTVNSNQTAASAAVSTEANARANADSASAARTDVLVSRFGASPNLCPDVDKWSLGTGFQIITDGWGKCARIAGVADGTYVCISPAISCYAGRTYTLTGDSLRFLTSGAVVFDMFFLDAFGVQLAYSPGNRSYSYHDHDNTNVNRDFHAVSFVAPTGAVAVEVRFYVEGGVGIQAAGFRQVKLEQRGLPATFYTQEGEISNTSAAIVTETTARTAANAAFTQLTNSIVATANTDRGTSVSGLQSEQTARANADGALTTRVDGLVATTNTDRSNTSAAITTEQNARTSATTSLAGRIDTLVATATTDRGNSTSAVSTEQTARLSADGALAARVDSVIATAVTDRTNNSSAIYTEQNARAGADGALNTRVDGLTATATTDRANNNASIVTEQNTRANADSSLAGQISAVTATANTDRSNTNSAIVTEQNARAGADGALSTRVDNVTATVNSNQTAALAAVSSEASARASADSVSATRTDVLFSQLGASPNLCPDVDKWTLGAGFQIITDGWGKSARIAGVPDGTYVCISPAISCYAGQTYTITGDSLRYMTSGAVVFDMLFLDAAGTGLSYSPGNRSRSYHDHSNDNSNRDFHAVQCVAPTGAVVVRVRFYVEGGVGIQAAGFRQVKLEQRGLPATFYTQEGEISNTSAAIVTEATARTTANTAFTQLTNAIVATANTDRGAATSGLTSEQTARVNADGALTTRVDGLVATANTDRGNTSAAITAEQTARAGADSSLAGQITAVAATATTDRGNTTSAITTEQNARAGADSALTTRVDTVVATASTDRANTNAVIVTEQTTRANADSSLAGQISALVAKTDTARSDTIASIVTEQNVRSNADSALSSQISSLSSAATTDRTNTNAAIVTEQNTRASAFNALAGQISTVVAEANISRVNTNSAIVTEQNVRAGADGALTTQINTVVANANTDRGNTSSAIQSVNQAIANGNAASATASQTIQARIEASPNLCPDVDKWSLTNTFAVDSNGWGKTVVSFAPPNGSYACNSPRFRVNGGQVYSITGDSLLFAASGAVFFNILFFDASGVLIIDGPNQASSTFHDFDNTGVNRRSTEVSCTAPTNATNAIARFVGYQIASGTALGFRQVKVEQRGLPTTAYTQEGIVDGLTGAIKVESDVRVKQTGELYAQYTVKTDTAGLISGFGLASTGNTATPNSLFGVRASAFYVAPPSVAQALAPTDNLYDGYVWLDTSVTPNVTRYRQGTSWVLNSPALPFIIQTVPTTINGLAVPPGVYINNAYIANGTITNAMIGLAQIDDAKIANLSASKVSAGSISVGAYINSSNYIPGTQGWSINGNGQAEFSGVVVRGVIYAQQGAIGGCVIGGDAISSAGYDGTNGWSINQSGQAYFGSARLRGSISGGDFTGFGFPAPGQNGFYLGPEGMLLGNPSNGGFLVMRRNGDFEAPGMSITGGALTINQVSVIDTLTLRPNAVTVPTAMSGGYKAQVTVDGGTGTVVHLLGTFVQGTGRNSFIVRMSVNGTQLAVESPIGNTIGVMSVQYFAIGVCTFSINSDVETGDMRCTILALGVKR